MSEEKLDPKNEVFVLIGFPATDYLLYDPHVRNNVLSSYVKFSRNWSHLEIEVVEVTQIKEKHYRLQKWNR